MSQKMLQVLVLAAGAMIASAVSASADGVTVYQEGKQFSEEEVTIKVGQTVTFQNKDAVTHNVFSTTPGMAFDLRTQKPGESTEIKFDSAGIADVMCAIHPQMKMKIKVEK